MRAKPGFGYYGAVIGQALGQPIGSTQKAMDSRNAALAVFGTQPGVIINPNYYNTDRGRRERASDIQNQLREATSELERQKQIVQSGSKIFSPEERQSRVQLADVGLTTIGAMEPLLASGVINTRQLDALLTHEVGAEFQTQRQQQKISRELQAISSQYKAGRLSDKALNAAIAEMHNEYGSAIISNPDFALLTGLEEQRDKARQQILQSFAEQEGLPSNRVRWNEQTNRPGFDKEAAEIDFYKSDMEDKAANRMSLLSQARSKAVAPLVKALWEAHNTPSAETEGFATIQAQIADQTLGTNFVDQLKSGRTPLQVMGEATRQLNIESPSSQNAPQRNNNSGIADFSETQILLPGGGPPVPLFTGELPKKGGAATAQITKPSFEIREALPGEGERRSRGSVVTYKGTDLEVPIEVVKVLEQRPELADLLIPASGAKPYVKPGPSEAKKAETARVKSESARFAERAQMFKPPDNLVRVELDGVFYRVPKDVASVIEKYPDIKSRVLQAIGARPEK